MRLARIRGSMGESDLALYRDDDVVQLGDMHTLQHRYAYSTTPLYPEIGRNTLAYLPPQWGGYRQAKALEELAVTAAPPCRRNDDGEECGCGSDHDNANYDDELDGPALPCEHTLFDIPVLMPSKVICLAGNYAEHIAEGGGQVSPKDEAFPNFFMKPPTTTLRPTGCAVVLPTNSPEHIDWEVELVVVIGEHLKLVDPEVAARGIAGYTVGLDMSNRRLRLNANRKQSERAAFFEWLCGKWHDGFAPIGPCVVAADDDFDPANAGIRLAVNGVTKQESNTANMVFNVFELVSYASSVMTLEPGDLIMTGTPSGVGDSRGEYLRRGDLIEATIDGIGTLTTRMV